MMRRISNKRIIELSKKATFTLKEATYFLIAMDPDDPPVEIDKDDGTDVASRCFVWFLKEANTRGMMPAWESDDGNKYRIFTLIRRLRSKKKIKEFEIDKDVLAHLEANNQGRPSKVEAKARDEFIKKAALHIWSTHSWVKREDVATLVNDLLIAGGLRPLAQGTIVTKLSKLHPNSRKGPKKQGVLPDIAELKFGLDIK